MKSSVGCEMSRNPTKDDPGAMRGDVNKSGQREAGREMKVAGVWFPAATPKIQSQPWVPRSRVWQSPNNVQDKPSREQLGHLQCCHRDSCVFNPSTSCRHLRYIFPAFVGQAFSPPPRALLIVPPFKLQVLGTTRSLPSPSTSWTRRSQTTTALGNSINPT